MEYYPAIKKNEIMLFAATWMDLEFIILSEGSQMEKDKYHIISLKKMIKMNLFTKQTHRERTYRYRGGGGVTDWA